MISATESKMIFKGDMPAGLKCCNCDKRDTCTESDKNVATYGDRYEVYDNCCYAVDTGNHDSASIMVQYEDGMHAIYSQNFVARKGAGRRGDRLIGYNATVEFDFDSKTIDLFYHNEDKHEHIDMKEQCATSHGGGDLVMVRAFADIMDGKKSTTPLSERRKRPTSACHMGHAHFLSTIPGKNGERLRLYEAGWRVGL